MGRGLPTASMGKGLSRAYVNCFWGTGEGAQALEKRGRPAGPPAGAPRGLRECVPRRHHGRHTACVGVPSICGTVCAAAHVLSLSSRLQDGVQVLLQPWSAQSVAPAPHHTAHIHARVCHTLCGWHATGQSSRKSAEDSIRELQRRGPTPAVSLHISRGRHVSSQHGAFSGFGAFVASFVR